MIRIFLSLIFLLNFAVPALATNFNDDANCMFSAGMEDDGNETDLSGEGNDLTETGGDIPQDADKKFGTYSRDFEAGDTEYLTHADNLSTDISGADQDISLVCWIKSETADITTASYPIAKFKDDGSNVQYALMVNTNELPYFRLSNDGTNKQNAFGATEVADGSWYHFGGVYNDIDMRVYIDGSLDSNGADNPKTKTNGIGTTAALFNLGARSDPTGYFDGLIDDVGVFDRELTSVEMSDIMTNGMAGAVAPSGFGQVIGIMIR